MVVALGPGKFYGSSLPRPHFYTDVKFNDDRVDPPVSMMDPLLSWATDAHWSMGGLGYKRLRLQGRIEGNLKRLQKEREKSQKKRGQYLTPIAVIRDDKPEFEGYLSDSPPPTPIVMKRKRRFALLDEEEEGPVKGGSRKRRLVRKLGDDFDIVADDAGKGNGKKSPLKEVANVDGVKSVALRTRSRRSEMNEEVKDLKKKKKLMKNGEEVVTVNESDSPLASDSSPNGVRTSPRLSKLGSKVVLKQ